MYCKLSLVTFTRRKWIQAESSSLSEDDWTYYTTQDICIYSYNSRGFHEGNQTVCNDLIYIKGNKIPILCNQENFLLKANKYKIEQCLPNFHVNFKPATKEGLNGRPKDGMFIAIPSRIKARSSDVSPLSPRLLPEPPKL